MKNLLLLFAIVLTLISCQMSQSVALVSTPTPLLPTVSDASHTPGTVNPHGNYWMKSWRVLTKNGGRLSWLRSQDIIAYDKVGSDGYYNVWTIKPDGTGDTCLTCSATALPHLNNGNPVWHPSGNFLALQVQRNPSLGYVGDLGARPGGGWNCDLWIMDAAGKHYWQITNVTPIEGGVVHPQFSRVGDKLAWAERINSKPAIYGTWQLKIGDFVVSADGVPSVQNIKTLTPGAQKLYYEPHGFSRDDKTLFFMAYLEPGQTDYGMDIYSLELATNKLTRLTDTMDQWDEFPTPMPFGSKLVWMSTIRTASTPKHFEGDLWMMDFNGSNKSQLTFFNDPTSPDYMPDGMALADPDWSADGRRLAVFANPGKGPAYPGEIWILDIEPPGK